MEDYNIILKITPEIFFDIMLDKDKLEYIEFNIFNDRLFISYRRAKLHDFYKIYDIKSLKMYYKIIKNEHIRYIICKNDLLLQMYMNINILDTHKDIYFCFSNNLPLKIIIEKDEIYLFENNKDKVKLIFYYDYNNIIIEKIRKINRIFVKYFIYKFTKIDDIVNYVKTFI